MIFTIANISYVLDRKEYQFLAEQRTFISMQFVTNGVIKTYIFFNRFY